MTSNLVAIGASSLISLVTFLFVAWIRGQMKERILELELRFEKEYVRKESFDKRFDELKGMIESLSRQIRGLQRIIDRRVSDEGDPED